MIINYNQIIHFALFSVVADIISKGQVIQAPHGEQNQSKVGQVKH